jgi:hypothetical protein
MGMIKKIFSRIFEIMDSMARARAASQFVAMGRHDLARAIMLKEDVKV